MVSYGFLARVQNKGEPEVSKGCLLQGRGAHYPLTGWHQAQTPLELDVLQPTSEGLQPISSIERTAPINSSPTVSAMVPLLPSRRPEKRTSIQTAGEFDGAPRPYRPTERTGPPAQRSLVRPKS